MNGIKILFKEKLSRFYALFLIFLIPVLIIANSLWRINVYQNNMNQELTNKTQIVAAILSSSISDISTNIDTLQQKLVSIKQANKEIDEINFLRSSDVGFSIANSTNSENQGVIISDADLAKINTSGQPLVRSYVDKSQKPQKRFWLAANPVKSADGSTMGILTVRINTDEIDAISRTTITQSLVLLVFTVFIVFLLLINYFRFFEYFVNFRKIQQLDKMKDEFISMVSHEVKTPLATVKGYLDMMFQGLIGKYDENTRQHLQKISANINRLDILVSELLDVSRLEQERMQFDMQPADASKVIANVINEIGDQAKNKGLTLEHNVPKQLPPVFVDPDRLHQVVENLVGNAIKYTPSGKISIDYVLDKGDLKISVKDTGIGMSVEDSKRLFERFYRIKNEKTTDISGTGLGLWISKTIANHMNGDIVFESKENVGSKFTLILPFIKE